MQPLNHLKPGDLCYKSRDQHPHKKQSYYDLLSLKLETFDNKSRYRAEHDIKEKGNH